MPEVTVPWDDVRPLAQMNGELTQVLASVDTLRAAWDEAIAEASSQEFDEARRRSLRRHAIETGIIERLYEVDWGVTEALVAEGLTAEVAAREGGVDANALEIIRTQYDALEFLVDAVRSGQTLTIFFVRELHQAICRAQRTYEARNDLGQILQVPLHHGTWKEQPNHVRRADGSLLEYVPPEQVQPQMERLVDLYNSMPDAHAIVQAAWLHHGFIRIHPFEDGNGRVARALTLLVLLREHYAPLVVDRTARTQYLAALDAANSGDLRELIRLFSRLEIVALRSELERPAEPAVAGAGAIDVARAYAGRLRTLQRTAAVARAAEAEALASKLQERVNSYLADLARGVRDQFATVDASARFSVDSAAPPDERAIFWGAQIIRTAREVDFFANVSKGSWWTRAHIAVLRYTLRFAVVIQKVGHGETGVLALTVFAEILPPRETNDERTMPLPALRSGPADSVTFVYSDDADVHWEEVCRLMDHALAAAVATFAQQLG